MEAYKSNKVDGFSPEARLLPTAYACKQTTPYGKRTNHICVATQHKVVEPVPSQPPDTKKPLITSGLSVGWDGWVRTIEMPESKSGALPLGYIPILR